MKGKVAMGFDGIVSLISNIFDRRTKMQMYILERLDRLDDKQDSVMAELAQIRADIDRCARIAHLRSRKDDMQAE